MADAWLTTLVAAHVLGAALWIGGQLALAPMTRAVRAELPDAERRRVLRAIARRAQPVLWAGLALAAISGLALLDLRGGLPSLAAGLPLAKLLLSIATAAGAIAHVLGARRSAPAWVVGGGAALALLAGLALVVVGSALRWS